MKLSREDFRQRLLPILLSQAVGLVCGVAGVRLTSRLVDPADYGLYGIFVSLVPLGAGVIYIGLVKFVVRHWRDAADRPGLLREVLAASLRKTPWLLGAAILAALVAAPGLPVIFGGLLFACAYLMTLTGLAQAALQAARQHWRDLGLSAALSVTRSFLPTLLYFASGAGLRALFLGFLGHALIGAVLGAASLRAWWRALPAQPRAHHLTPHYDGARFTTLAIAGWILLGMNRWLVAWFFGPETAGYFTLAGNIGIILPAMLGQIMQQYQQPAWFAVPTTSRPERQALLREVDRTAGLYTLLALGLAAGVQACLPWMVGPVVGTNYLPATAFVLGTGFATVSITIGTFYHAMLLAARQEKACAQADLGGGACLMAGSILSAAAGLEWFKGWLLVAPAVPWLVNRTLARRALLSAA